MSFIKCQWWSQDFCHNPDGNLSRVDPVQSRIKSIIITASSIVSLRSHQQQSQQVASNQHQASIRMSLRFHQHRAFFIVSMRFHQHRASIQHRVSLRFIPHKNPQLCCWRRPLMVRQPYSEAVQSDVSVPYKGNRRGRKDY